MPHENHQHHLDCIEPINSTDPKLRGRLWFCRRLAKFIEGPDPNIELKARRARMQADQDARLREIAAKHGLDLPTITKHADRIYEEGTLNPIQRSSKRSLEKRHPAVMEAWDELPGSYSYYSAAYAMKRALGGKP